MIDDGAPHCAAPARRALLRRIADVLESTGSTVRLVAIDGVDGSGKTRFAEELANAITRRPVIVVHLDDFLHPRELRHRRGRSSPEGFWLDTYDYAACVIPAARADFRARR